MQSIYIKTANELKKELKDFKSYRVNQLIHWLHIKLISDFSEIKNLPKDMISFLKANYFINDIKIIHSLKSKIDGSKKMLFLLEDGFIVEGVVLPYKYGNTFCISTQVGCKMKCSFCASTKDGLLRNVETSEMIRMYYLLKKEDERLNRIVFMGSGEPLDNYDNVLSFIKILNEDHKMSERNITLSTCGVVDNIYKLADENLKITLTVSLHSANNDIRKTIMPITNKYPLKDLKEAMDYYQNKTSRRVSIEYAMIFGENDTIENADELIKFIGRSGFHVNLIPLNKTDDTNLKSASTKSINKFIAYLKKNKINATIRRTMASDIEGACGQLKNSYLKK